METNAPLSFWEKNKLIIKAFFIGILILALLIPTFSIMFLVREREGRRNEVVKEVSSKWADAQTLTGPFIAVPYLIETKDEKGAVSYQKEYVVLLPDNLKINGKIMTQLKHRSIFQVPVYNSEIHIEGSFGPVKADKLPVALSSLHLQEAVVCMGISDFKGIGENLKMRWNDTTIDFETGLPPINWLDNGVSCPLKISQDALLTANNSFSIDFTLKGSEQLFVTPLGNLTNVHIAGDWQNPAFDGKYLPDTTTVSAKGFSADWKILHFNRTYPQYFSGSRNLSIGESTFGFKLLQPVDAYSQTLRSVKYAILIIALTFFLYFFLEIYYRRSVHPLQYILIGFALVIFYTLLLSVSEYLQFGYAYLLAAVATVVLIGLYTRSIFKKWSAVLLFSLILSMLYLFIYVLIQLQDNALLFGSLGLFILLSLIMYFSRKISWSNPEKQVVQNT